MDDKHNLKIIFLLASEIKKLQCQILKYHLDASKALFISHKIFIFISTVITSLIVPLSEQQNVTSLENSDVCSLWQTRELFVFKAIITKNDCSLAYMKCVVVSAHFPIDKPPDHKTLSHLAITGRLVDSHGKGLHTYGDYASCLPTVANIQTLTFAQLILL